MSRYTGKQGKGAAKRVHEQKRVEAEERNAKTPEDQRRKNRTPEAKLLLEVFTEQ